MIRHIRSRYSISRNQGQTICRIKQIPRQVKSYKKTYWSDFKKDLAIFTNMFTMHKHKDQNHLRDMFKSDVNRLSTLHILTRQIKSTANLPWVTHEIVKLIKKRQNVHTTEKGACSHKKVNTLKKFKHLKSTIQTRIRNGHGGCSHL